MPLIRTARPVVLLALGAVVAVLSHAELSGAQETGEAAAAHALFDEALADMKAGRWTVACPKLERGTILDRGIGMRHNLALCYENTGRTASAWKLFLEVEADAKAQGQTQRAQIARGHADELEPRLAHITVVVHNDARVEGLEVRRDGKVLEPQSWGVKVPADPGTHIIEASVPGGEPWRKEVAVVRERELVIVTVPKIGLHSPSALQREPEPLTHAGMSTTRKWGLALGGLGLVGVAVGSVFGARALSKNADSDEQGCKGDVCTKEAASLRRDARTNGNISTAAFLLGGFSLVAGATLWIVGRPTDSRTVSLRLTSDSALVGVTLTGGW